MIVKMKQYIKNFISSNGANVTCYIVVYGRAPIIPIIIPAIRALNSVFS